MCIRDRAASNPMPENPYQWSDSTVENILANRQYTGCAVNFATTTVSYKVHKTVYRPPEEQQIIPDMQEPIISEKQWLRVQELREHRRRPTKTGRTSLFSGLVYCPDCGAKLHFAAAKSITRNQEHFRCSNYKSGRGKCTVHFIRDVVLERIAVSYTHLPMGKVPPSCVAVNCDIIHIMLHSIGQNFRREMP